LAKRGENNLLLGDAALMRAIEHYNSHEDVWFASRLEIAEHWAKENPPMSQTRPSEMDRIAALRLIEKCSA
jgi:hypothetical protein